MSRFMSTGVILLSMSLALAACATKGDLASVAVTADQSKAEANHALQTAQQALATAQKAEQEAQAADQRANKIYDRSLHK